MSSPFAPRATRAVHERTTCPVLNALVRVKFPRISMRISLKHMFELLIESVRHQVLLIASLYLLTPLGPTHLNSGVSHRWIWHIRQRAGLMIWYAMIWAEPFVSIEGADAPVAKFLSNTCLTSCWLHPALCSYLNSISEELQLVLIAYCVCTHRSSLLQSDPIVATVSIQNPENKRTTNVKIQAQYFTVFECSVEYISYSTNCEWKENKIGQLSFAAC